MFLLIQTTVWSEEKIKRDLHSTMFLLIRDGKQSRRVPLYNLHSTMFLLIRSRDWRESLML